MIRKALCYHRLQDEQFDMGTNTYIKRIGAKVIDIQEEAIVQACIDAAKEAGIHDLYLLDKQFVVNALLDKVGKTAHARWEEDTMEQHPGGFRCSRCRCAFFPPYQYCPCCGAKMDGEIDA